MIATRYTFRALNAEGGVIVQSRGRAGALALAIEALQDYRDAVASGSGRLYGDPQRLGTYSVDGVVEAFGGTSTIDDHADEIARLDRLGVARVAQLSADVAVEIAA